MPEAMEATYGIPRLDVSIAFFEKIATIDVV